MKKIKLHLILFLIHTSFFAQIPNNIPTDGLVGYWPFDGNANDESGNGNDGTVNGATLTTDRFGNPDSAYYFSSAGCATRIDADVNTSSIQTGLTISLWALKVGNGCIGPRLFEFWPGNDGSGLASFTWDNSNQYIIMASITESGFISSSTVPISQNNIWTHLVYTNDGVHGKFYKDGVLINTIASNGNPILAGNLAIGRMNHPAWDAFNGKLDDFGIWDRALTNQEISNIYNNCTPPAAPTGSAEQTLCDTATVEDLTATGENIQWYDAATGGNLLDSTTALTDGQMVYASQTIDGCESEERLAVTVSIQDLSITASATTICTGTAVNLSITGVSSSGAIGNTQTPNPWPNPSSFDAGIISLGQFGSPTIFSTSFWINPESTQNEISIILDCSHGGSSNWVLQSFGDNNYTWGNLTVSLTPNVWQHVLLTYNNGVKKCFVNGELTTTTNQTINYSGNPNLNLGNWPEGGRRFNGKIDELYVTYNIIETSNFIPQQTITNILPNTMGLWHFDEGSGSTSLNSNNSTNIDIGSWYWTSRGQLSATYLWSTGETTATINPTPTATTTYWCDVTVNGVTCREYITIDVTAPAAPTGNAEQTLCDTATVEDLTATGENIQWYDAATGGNLLDSTTALTDGQMVYASQTIDGCESEERLAVTVSIQDLSITASDTEVCSETSVNLQVNLTPSPSQGAMWELLIPASSYNGNQLNLSETGYDRNNNYIFSLFKQGNNLITYRFNLNDNTVSNILTTNIPPNIGPFTFDFSNNRLIAARTGRESIYAVSANGGAWTQIGSGSSDQESFSAQYYWNPDSQKTGFFGGYGFFAVKNWIWENGGTWINSFLDNNNCGIAIPAKRTTQLALGSPNSNKIYFFSGQGSCSGQQTANSCNLGSPWATDVGIYCWLKDLWELDLTNHTFNNILPVNNSSITKEGNIVYNYIENSFYIIGGYIPSPIYNSNTGNTTNFETSVLKYNLSSNTGFESYAIEGTPPPLLTLNSLGNHKSYFDALNNQIIWIRKDGVWAIKLSNSNSTTSVLWSTGDTTETISVTPTETTEYWVDITVNGVTCREYITINVTIPAVPTAENIQSFNNGDTLDDLIVTGTNLQWYANSSDTNSIPSSTALVNGTTYYVSQTVNGCESEKLAITVTETLGVDDEELKGFSLYPNPTKDKLYLNANVIIGSVEIYNLLGQAVGSYKFNSNTAEINLNVLENGMYIIRVNNRQNSYAVIKF